MERLDLTEKEKSWLYVTAGNQGNDCADCNKEKSFLYFSILTKIVNGEEFNDKELWAIEFELVDFKDFNDDFSEKDRDELLNKVCDIRRNEKN